DAERALLLRPPGGGWTPADVPLLDEAAELLGEDDSQTRWAELARRQREIEYAEGALEIAMGSRSIDLEDEADPELLTAVDLLAADRLAERQEDGERLTAAERAAADRRWAYGHVIVDEAQELSPMAWRLLMRRCPSRSMTVVGDVAQTGDAAGTSSWAAVLSPYVADRWRRAELTVSYRTPGEILDVAAGVLAGVGPGLTVPRAVRESGERPWAVRVPPERLGAELVALVRAEADGAVGGRVGVIVPPARLPELGAAVAAAVPGTGLGDEPDLERRTVVLTVAQVKGLEFDAVLVVEPAEIVAGTPRGHSDLYVALTRATRRLGVLHAGELPGVLAGALAVRQPRPA
ncbi:MAG TPA: ATP-binding domain-containing protein, partial [Pilimelia sp.]|nr:ATP-binding domain-containing protein [Pilimelia sp.]